MPSSFGMFSRPGPGAASYGGMAPATPPGSMGGSLNRMMRPDYNQQRPARPYAPATLPGQPPAADGTPPERRVPPAPGPPPPAAPQYGDWRDNVAAQYSGQPPAPAPGPAPIAPAPAPVADAAMPISQVGGASAEPLNPQYTGNLAALMGQMSAAGYLPEQNPMAQMQRMPPSMGLGIGMGGSPMRRPMAMRAY